MIATRKFRPMECYSSFVDSFHLHILGADRLFEAGDNILFCGNSGEYIELQVEDRKGRTRWIDMADDQIFVCETMDAARN